MFLSIVFIVVNYFVIHYPNDAELFKQFGPSTIPQSDAERWTRGSLQFYFGLIPEDLTRVNVGIIFSSLFSLTHTLQNITIFPFLLLAFSISLSFVSAVKSQQIAIIGFVCTLYLLYDKIFGAMPIGSIMVDPFAFVFSLSGFLLIWQGVASHKPNWLLIIVALLFIGSAAAIRGMQLFTGILWVLMISIWFHKHLSIKKIVILIVIFLLPIIVEMILHKYYGITSNLSTALWTFVTPPHIWTVAANDELMQLLLVDKSLTHVDIYWQYIQYLFSPTGVKTFASLVANKIMLDIQPIANWKFLALAILMYIPSVIWFLRSKDKSTSARYVPYLIASFNLLIVLLSKTIPIDSLKYVYVTWLGINLFLSIRYRMYASALLMGLYLGSVITFILLASSGGARTASTFEFAFYFLILMLIYEPCFQTKKYESKEKNLLFLSHSIVLFFLYFGWALLPSPFKQELQYNIGNPNVAIKLGNHAFLKRSLYFRANGQTFLTAYDNVPIGYSVAFDRLISYPPPERIQRPGYSDNSKFYAGSLYKPAVFVNGRVIKN